MGDKPGIVYIMVGDAVVSDSAGNPRQFTRKTARNYKRGRGLAQGQKMRVVESILGCRKRLRINDDYPPVLSPHPSRSDKT